METDRKVIIPLSEYKMLVDTKKAIEEEKVFVYDQSVDSYGMEFSVYYTTKDEAINKLIIRVRDAENKANVLMEANKKYVKMLKEKCVQDIKKRSLWDLIWTKLFVREPKK